jgi:hypothetical protein
MLAEMLTGDLFSWNAIRRQIVNIRGQELFKAPAGGERINGPGLDLVRQMLELKPAGRCTVQDALLHAYFHVVADSDQQQLQLHSAAAAFSALHSRLAVLRPAVTAASVTMSISHIDDWPQLLAKLAELEHVAVNLRFDVALEIQPLSTAATWLLAKLEEMADKSSVRPVLAEWRSACRGLVSAGCWPSA